MWWEVSELAARQHGVVSRQQLLGRGLSVRSIERELQRGRLHRVYRGVYVPGQPRIGYFGRCMAAVLACGDGALLSHRAAGQLHALRTGSWIEVTVPRGRHGPRGIGVHETRRLPTALMVDGIPTTSVARTLVDLADVVSYTRLDGAFADAERLRILDLRDVKPIPGRRGTKSLEAVIAGLRPGESKSRLELRFKRFLRQHGFPWPAFNTLVHGVDVDAVWPEYRLIIELDSYEFHGKARKPFEEDRAKSNALQLAGYRVIRVTSRMLDRPEELRVQLAELFASGQA